MILTLLPVSFVVVAMGKRRWKPLMIEAFRQREHDLSGQTRHAISSLGDMLYPKVRMPQLLSWQQFHFCGRQFFLELGERPSGPDPKGKWAVKARLQAHVSGERHHGAVVYAEMDRRIDHSGIQTG